jgi:endonuclease/exonuclease/phosphatase family metal-dependent hydrolase
MKLASFNLESLFDRAKALNLDTWTQGKTILDAYGSLNKLLAKPTYSPTDKAKILDGLDQLGVLKKDDAGPFVLLRQNRGKLLKRPKSGPVQVVAGGRGEWIGWLELKTEPVDEIATRNTAQVIRDVGADVFGVVEVDSRVALQRFNAQLLQAVQGTPYVHVMIIDGNDERGIDVGLMTRDGFPIVDMRSHVDDVKDGALVFSRDCPEYTISLPGGGQVLLLVNHFKSKGFGTPADSNLKRRRQAETVRQIYEARLQAGITRIAVIGDFNDTPDSAPLQPLLGQGSSLRDVSLHPQYQNDGRPGTFANGTKSEKFDYILLSPALFAAVTAAGVFRKGVWGGAHGMLWPIYPEMTTAVQAASDHAAIWVDLNV